MVESRLEMKEARDARIGPMKPQNRFWSVHAGPKSSVSSRAVPALGRRGLALGRRDQVRGVREGNFLSCNLLKIIDIGKSSREGAGI